MLVLILALVSTVVVGRPCRYLIDLSRRTERRLKITIPAAVVSFKVLAVAAVLTRPDTADRRR
jgi:hypothetical protein